VRGVVAEGGEVVAARGEVVAEGGEVVAERGRPAAGGRRRPRLRLRCAKAHLRSTGGRRECGAQPARVERRVA
jgi:hypothetical protein